MIEEITSSVTKKNKCLEKLLLRLDKAGLCYTYNKADDSNCIFKFKNSDLLYTKHSLIRIRHRTNLSFYELNKIEESISSGLVIKQLNITDCIKKMMVSTFDNIENGESYIVLNNNLLYILKKNVNTKVLITVMPANFCTERYLKPFEIGDVCDYISFNNLYNKYFSVDYRNLARTKNRPFSLKNFLSTYNPKMEYIMNTI